jgi:DNA replication and repair protein RecF
MRLTHLSLHNFRNFVRLDLDLEPGVTVLLGDNAQGKTNLLEAVFYLATSRSPHAGADRELVSWLVADREPIPYARLVGRVARRTHPISTSPQPDGRIEGQASEWTIEITLTQEMNNGARYRKQIRLNGVPRRAMDLLGHLNVVLFLPEDIDLVYGAPGLRRRYLDVTLCQIDPPYCAALARYNEVVSQRNALLRDLGERGGDPDQLGFWDERLVQDGSYLVDRRRHAIVALDELAHRVHAELTDGAERLHLRYLPSVELSESMDNNAIAGTFSAQLQALRRREIAAGVTLIGPHRDEVRFLIDEVDAGIYGSRGQQRTAALALKLAEVELMQRETGEQPVLLLDDVLSELDARRRHFLVHRLNDGLEQALVTATDLHVFPPEFLCRCCVWSIQLGQLSEVTQK